jgi:maltose alpha-D-glucosyltransferase/alpha-amylase
MTTFLLEKSVYELNYELNNRPDWVIIPLRGIQAILQKSGLPEIEVATV